MLRLKPTLLAIVLPACLLSAGCGGTASSDSPSSVPKASIVGVDGESSPNPTRVRPTPGPTLPPTINAGRQELEPRPPRDLHPVVTIKTSQGDITVRLDREKSPLTVENFLDYVSRGFYDQTAFHYVHDGYMIAAGGFNADLSPKTPRAEILNESDNGVKNLRYTVAMARNPDLKDSATSQFYINLADNRALDYISEGETSIFGYCVFGEVVDGQDVVDSIAKTPVHDEGAFIKTPVEPVVIQTIVRHDD